jgi:tRNA(fMet)-specific endonuclease VapC
VRRYLLDTNIVSYFIRGQCPALIKRMRLELDEQSCVISSAVRAEVRYGQALMAANDKRRQPINLLLNDLPTLSWDIAAADQYGLLMAELKRGGTPIGHMDTMIAAHALAAGLTIVTHNLEDFERVPHLKLEDWTA